MLACLLASPPTTDVAVHSDLAAKKPHGVSLAQAAACPLAGLVAWECARVKVVPRPGDTVLVAGASGGVCVSSRRQGGMPLKDGTRVCT